MATTVLKAADYRRMPWKNGGGETTEITVVPPGASLESFDWRISMALVKSDGPFSVFPGIDRTLSILDGEGVRLTVDQADFDLTRESDPLAFSAEAPAGAVLTSGAITDLNVMSRRSTYRHEVRRYDVAGSTTVITESPTVVVFCDTGAVTLSGQAMAILGPRDTAIMDGPGTLTVTAERGARVYVISLWKIT